MSTWNWSINADIGTTINELEATLIWMHKMAEKKAQEKPNGGFVMAKGKPNEIRLKYSEMADVIFSLKSKLGMEGCLSFGICKTCTNFRKDCPGDKWGKCRGKDHHEYDSCDQHSVEGGSFGIEQAREKAAEKARG